MSVECFPVFKYGIIMDADELEKYVYDYGDETIDGYKESLSCYCEEFDEYMTQCDHYLYSGPWIIGYSIPTDRPVDMQEMLDISNNKDIKPLISKIFPQMPADLRDELLEKSGFISTVEWC